MTTKTRPYRFGYSRHTRIIYKDDGSVVNDLTSSALSKGTDTVTLGPPISRYRKVIASGGNATTDAGGSRTISISTVPANLQVHIDYDPSTGQRSRIEEYTGDLFVMGDDVHMPDYTLVSSPTAENQSLVRFYADLASATTNFKGMVFAGELSESLRMILNPGKSLRRGIVDYLGALKKRVPRRATRRRKRKAISDTWLEFAYGWNPLISDLDSAIKAFYASDMVRPIFQMCRGHGSQKISNIGGFIDSAIGGMATKPWMWYNVVEERSVKHYGILRSDGRGVSNFHKYGFRPAEFIPTLWELIPYSFLVDYFTNIGDIVSSWSYRFIEPAWCARTIFERLSLESFQSGVDMPPTVPGIQTVTRFGNPGSTSASKTRFSRVANVPLTLPSLEISVPGLTSTKWVNLAALATSLHEARRHINP